MKKAADAAEGDKVLRERVAMTASGFQNVTDYLAICDQMARGDFPAARKTLDAAIARIEVLEENGQANREYGTGYLKRFLGKTLDGVVAATAKPNRVVKVLPDQWKFHRDPMDDGEARMFHRPDHDDSAWQDVATYSATLSHQGVDSNAVLWYRTTFDVPEKSGPLALVFAEIDGDATVWVNGTPVEPKLAVPPAEGKKVRFRRQPLVVDLSGVVVPGPNRIAVRADNRSITELFLGGIIRPVLLVEKSGK